MTQKQNLDNLVTTLPRNTGKEIFYSAHDLKAQEIASLYATKKWGKHVALEQGRIIRREQPMEHEREPERKRQQGLGR